jgi:hypothetical protein
VRNWLSHHKVGVYLSAASLAVNVITWAVSRVWAQETAQLQFQAQVLDRLARLEAKVESLSHFTTLGFSRLARRR